MANVDSNKLMGLLIIAGGVFLLSQENIKQRRKRQKSVHPFIRKRDSKGAYYSIINESRLMHKEDFRKNLGVNTFILHITNLQKTIGSHSCTCSIKIKIKIMSFQFFYTVQVDTDHQKIFYHSCL